MATLVKRGSSGQVSAKAAESGRNSSTSAKQNPAVQLSARHKRRPPASSTKLRARAQGTQK